MQDYENSPSENKELPSQSLRPWRRASQSPGLTLRLWRSKSAEQLKRELAPGKFLFVEQNGERIFGKPNAARRFPSPSLESSSGCAKVAEGLPSKCF